MRIGKAGAAIAMGVLVGGCGSEAGPETSESTHVAVRARDGRADIAILARAVIEKACRATVCFDVESTEALRSVAVQAEICPGAAVAARLYRATPDEYFLVDASPIEVAESPPCPAVPAGSLAFEGLEGTHYIVCTGYTGASSAGDVTVHAAAGSTCATGATVSGTCRRCRGRGGDSATGQDGREADEGDSEDREDDWDER